MHTISTTSPAPVQEFLPSSSMRDVLTHRTNKARQEAQLKNLQSAIDMAVATIKDLASHQEMVGEGDSDRHLRIIHVMQSVKQSASIQASVGGIKMAIQSIMELAEGYAKQGRAVAIERSARIVMALHMAMAQAQIEALPIIDLNNLEKDLESVSMAA